MNGLKKLNSQIAGYQKQVNEIKRKIGYHEDEIHEVRKEEKNHHLSGFKKKVKNNIRIYLSLKISV